MTNGNRIKQIEQMVEKLYRFNHIEKSFRVLYKSDKEEFNYFYSFSGWLNNKYFSISIYCLKGYEEQIEITHNTDCKKEIKTLINKLLEDVKTIQ